MLYTFSFVHFPMRTNNLYPTNNNHHNYFLKMTKTRTVTVLLMIISTCAVILSLTDAYPTSLVPTEENLTEANPDPKNTTHLVITHIVKTIEFEVGVLEDDGVDSDSGTDLTTSQYIETDIKLLNVDLLREILDKVAEEKDSLTTKRPEDEEEEEVKEELVPSQATEERTPTNINEN